MNEPALPSESTDLPAVVRTRTPARLFVGRAGASYRTATWLALRQDHAAALDAVYGELDLDQHLGRPLLERFQLFAVQSQAGSKEEYLLRPDLGRRLGAEARAVIAERCPAGVDLQIVIGDGLSARAVAVQVPRLLPELVDGAGARGWRVGQSFVVRHCRVGVLNDVGELLAPAVVVLLIGERPGLATADSLSAYLAYRPQPGHTDAQRNLISNIHARGVPAEAAAPRILALADKLRVLQVSGTAVKEDSQPLAP